MMKGAENTSTGTLASAVAPLQQVKAGARLGHEFEGARKKPRKREAEHERLQGFEGGRIDRHGQVFPSGPTLPHD